VTATKESPDRIKTIRAHARIAATPSYLTSFHAVDRPVDRTRDFLAVTLNYKP
jgi:hypothetical protein